MSLDKTCVITFLEPSSFSPEPPGMFFGMPLGVETMLLEVQGTWIVRVKMFQVTALVSLFRLLQQNTIHWLAYTEETYFLTNLEARSACSGC